MSKCDIPCVSTMSAIVIDDEWVLNRLSKESKSFTQWAKDLDDYIKRVTTTTQDLISKKMEKKNVNNIDTSSPSKFLTPFIEKKIEEQGKNVDDLDIDLSGLKELDALVEGIKAFKPSSGGFFSNLASSISKNVQSSLKESNFGKLMDKTFAINLDFISGKRKTLAEALYDTAEERGVTNKGILYLIKSLPDLESFLYSTSAKKFYRDHTEHQLRVAVLGDFLLEQDLGQGKLLNIIADLTELDKTGIKEKYWWVTGLIHDIGYPLEKLTTSVNWSLVNQILKCYPHLDLEMIPLEVTLSSKGRNQAAYLEIIEEGMSKEAKYLIRNGAGYNLDGPLHSKSQVFLSNPEKGHGEFNYKPSIALDHGVVGAINLLASLGSPETIKQNNDEYRGYVEAAKAIAVHNFKDRLPEFTFDKNPLSFLLVLIDELQEWGRPIPYQIRDTYFNASLEKITLLDNLQVFVDEVEFRMDYVNKEAKELMDFNFGLYSKGKDRGFIRLKREELFPSTKINLRDIEMKSKSHSSEERIEIHLDNLNLLNSENTKKNKRSKKRKTKRPTMTSKTEKKVEPKILHQHIITI